jgi:hypothetical protein
LQAAFRSVLSDQLVIDGATEQLQRLRFLSLKNLAGVIASPSRAHEALQLYALAAREDASDVALWDRYGTLAAETGEWAAAKSAFEEALSRDPRHPTVSSKLLQVLVHVGDTTRADAFAEYCLEQDPWHPLARRVVRNTTGEEIVAAGTNLLSLPSVYNSSPSGGGGGPATPDPSSAALFPTKYIATVALEKASWRVLLRQCIKLLSNPLAAVANVKFVAPEDVAAVPSPAAPGAPTVVAEPAIIIEDEKLLEKPPTEELAAATVDDNDKKTAEAAPPPTENKGYVVSPQRRSIRSTKSRHKSQGSNAITNNTSTAETTTTDPFNLLRTLAPSLSPPQRPDSAQLTEPLEDSFTRPGSAGGSGNNKVLTRSSVHTITAAEESEEVHSCELLNTHSVSAIHAAITLVLHFTEPQHAARLPQLASSSGAVLKLVSMLEKQQWKGQGMSPEQYLILGELFSDAATTAMRAHAASPGNTSAGVRIQSSTVALQHNLSELNLAEFQRGGALWLSRFRAANLSHSGGGRTPSISTSTATATASTSGRKTSSNVDSATTTDDTHLSIEARYWWARGRLNEAASKPTAAYECYSQCSALLLQQQKLKLQSILAEGKTTKKSKSAAKTTTTTSSITITTAIEIKLPHCCLDATITAKTVQAKLELLQLHGVLTEAETLLSQDNRYADVAALLAPVLLACSETESLMASVDRPTWIKALRTLRNAADKVEDTLLALRCHLRLLCAGLPMVPSTIEAVLRGTRIA